MTFVESAFKENEYNLDLYIEGLKKASQKKMIGGVYEEITDKDR